MVVPASPDTNPMRELMQSVHCIMLTEFNEKWARTLYMRLDKQNTSKMSYFLRYFLMTFWQCFNAMRKKIVLVVEEEMKEKNEHVSANKNMAIDSTMK